MRMEKGTPSVDVVIATFQAPPERLARSIRSGLACPGNASGRVIVVDDGGEPAVDAARAGGLPDRVEVIRQSNAGPAAARNTGLGESRADLVVFIDDDDELIPAGVAAMAALVGRLGASGAVGARVNILPDGREELKEVPPEWADRVLPHPSHVLRPIGLFGASGAMVTRAAIAAGVRFDEGLRLGEDRDFLHRIAEHGGLGVSVKPALRVAIHEGGANLSSPAHYARRIRDHVVVMERYRDEVANGHLREATRWLINAAAKAGVDGESWELLVGAARARGWGVPVKARIRRAIR